MRWMASPQILRKMNLIYNIKQSAGQFLTCTLFYFPTSTRLSAQSPFRAATLEANAAGTCEFDDNLLVCQSIIDKFSPSFSPVITGRHSWYAMASSITVLPPVIHKIDVHITVQAV